MKKIFFIVISLLVVIGISVAILEYLSKNNQCPNTRSDFNPCSGLGGIPAMEETPQEIKDLKKKRIQRETVSKEEYAIVMDLVIQEVPDSRLGGYHNGVACGSYGLVRNDMPSEAKKYVKRHELEHLLGEGEYEANMSAVKAYPLGFLQTIFFSMKKRAEYGDGAVCYSISMWKTFKLYFLPSN